MKPLVIQEYGYGLNGISQAELSSLVASYFSLAFWSLEKDEWNSMFEFEEMAFVS